VLRHDVAADDPPPGPFDLIHARLVLVHLPGRDRVLASLAGALRPGGWLVVEDADPALQPLACIDESGPDQALANKVRAGFRVLLARRGVDLCFGRTLPRALRALGLEKVGADAYFPIAAPQSAVLERATIEQIRDGLIASGLATDEEIDRLLAAISAGRLDLATAPLISAWGRKPAGTIVA
jgi:SAM-dependent methyltransferase